MDDQEMARLHSAGATVTHRSPFEDLPAHRNTTPLSGDFIQKWVVPYYIEVAAYGDLSWVDKVKTVKPEITKDLCLALLGDFNWRTRKVGAYFAAIKGYRELIDIIGTHLLKSEVCCVGHIYALILAFFNEERSIQYLSRYLDYYLTKPSLYFDQEFVMQALLFLDKRNGADYSAGYLDKWKMFQEERRKIRKLHEQELQRTLGRWDGTKDEDHLQRFEALEKKQEIFRTEYFPEQISILEDLSRATY